MRLLVLEFVPELQLCLLEFFHPPCVQSSTLAAHSREPIVSALDKDLDVLAIADVKAGFLFLPEERATLHADPFAVHAVASFHKNELRVAQPSMTARAFRLILANRDASSNPVKRRGKRSVNAYGKRLGQKGGGVNISHPPCLETKTRRFGRVSNSSGDGRFSWSLSGRGKECWRPGSASRRVEGAAHRTVVRSGPCGHW